MSSVAHVWFAALQKLTAILSLASGIIVIAACTYTTSKVLNHGPGNGTSTLDEFMLSDVSVVHDKLKKIIVVCSSVGIVTGLAQVLVSLSVLCSCTKRIAKRTYAWLALHILIFSTLLGCILIPLSFHQWSAEPHALKDMMESVKKNVVRTFGMNDFSDLESPMNSYFISLILNEVIILILMIINCCFMRCGMHEYDTLDNASMSSQLKYQ